MTRHALILDHLHAYPEKSLDWIAKQCGVSRAWVSAVNAQEGIREIRKRRTNGVKVGGPLGELLRHAEARYTVAELAALSGLNESHIVGLRSGRNHPTLFTFECLVSALGLEITFKEKSQ